MSEGEKNLIKVIEDMWICDIVVPMLIMDKQQLENFKLFEGYLKIGNKHYWECDFGRLELKLR